MQTHPRINSTLEWGAHRVNIHPPPHQPSTEQKMESAWIITWKSENVTKIMETRCHEAKTNTYHPADDKLEVCLFFFIKTN